MHAVIYAEGEVTCKVFRSVSLLDTNCIGTRTYKFKKGAFPIWNHSVLKVTAETSGKTRSEEAEVAAQASAFRGGTDSAGQTAEICAETTFKVMCGKKEAVGVVCNTAFESNKNAKAPPWVGQVTCGGYLNKVGEIIPSGPVVDEIAGLIEQLASELKEIGVPFAGAIKLVAISLNPTSTRYFARTKQSSAIALKMRQKECIGAVLKASAPEQVFVNNWGKWIWRSVNGAAPSSLTFKEDQPSNIAIYRVMGVSVEAAAKSFIQVATSHHIWTHTAVFMPGFYVGSDDFLTIDHFKTDIR